MSKLDSNKFTLGGYAFLMFMTNYYKRVQEHGLDMDELIVLNTVVAHFCYAVNSKSPKSLENLINMSEEETNEFFQNAQLSILSIATITGQPKESVRRRVQKLIQLNYLEKRKKGISLGSKYNKFLNSFGKVTNVKFSKLIKTLNNLEMLDTYLANE